jgi:chitin synthase
LVSGWLTSAQIIYTAIVGLVMVAAFLEWFLWIAAFMYCLWKVFVKAEHWTVRLLAILVGTAFLLLRYFLFALCYTKMNIAR